MFLNYYRFLLLVVLMSLRSVRSFKYRSPCSTQRTVMLARKQSSTATFVSVVSKAMPPEPLWKEQLSVIRRARQVRGAPVDTDGADALMELARLKGGKASDARFEVLISAILSSQTKDERTSAALRALSDMCYPDPLSGEALGKKSVEDVAVALRPVSFYKTKAPRIIEVSRILVEQYGGDIPQDMKSLLALPGVGPKVAVLVMDVAWGATVGICVDTHVHRLSNRLGWTNSWGDEKKRSSNGAEKSRAQLEGWLPREYWPEINPLLVGYGQTVCTAINPKCGSCELSAQNLCPSAKYKGKLPLVSVDRLMENSTS